MANQYSPDPLNSGGKRWDVLAKNSSQDGDYSWQSLDIKWPEYPTQTWTKDFAWQAKDYALLGLFDPMNHMRIDTDNRPSFVLSNGSGDGNNTSYFEFLNIPQTYRTLVLRGQYYEERGTNPNWLYCRANNYSGSSNAQYFSRWHSQSTTTQNLDSTSIWGIARGYQPDSYNNTQFEIVFNGYSREGQPLSWYGWRTSEEQAYANYGMGWCSGDKNDSNRNVGPIRQLTLFPSDGYIHAHSWFALYGIK